MIYIYYFRCKDNKYFRKMKEKKKKKPPKWRLIEKYDSG